MVGVDAVSCVDIRTDAQAACPDNRRVILLDACLLPWQQCACVRKVSPSWRLSA